MTNNSSQPPTKSKNIFRSIVAVIAGVLAIVILSIATDFILEKVGIFPVQTMLPAWMLGIALFYRTLYAAVGGYITAALAPKKPMDHVKILEIIGVIFGVLGVITGWNLSAHWYPIALVITSFIAVWLGGKLKVSYCSKVADNEKLSTSAKAN